MANIKSAKKRTRQIAKKTIHNKQLKSELRTYRKYFTSSLEAGESKEVVQGHLNRFVAMAQKLGRKRLFHPSTMSRHISRAYKLFASKQS